jgi:hypothetical protein
VPDTHQLTPERSGTQPYAMLAKSLAQVRLESVDKINIAGEA